MTIMGHLGTSPHADTQEHRLMEASQYEALSVFVALTSIVEIHTSAFPGFHLDVTCVTSTHFVPLPVLVTVGFTGHNKLLSHTSLRGFGNSSSIMRQKEREL